MKRSEDAEDDGKREQWRSESGQHPFISSTHGRQDTYALFELKPMALCAVAFSIVTTYFWYTNSFLCGVDW